MLSPKQTFGHCTLASTSESNELISKARNYESVAKNIWLKQSPEDRARLRQCYEAANPLFFASLLAASPPPADALVMEGYYFVKDNASIFAGLIEILYCMRNMLFHGELVPDSKTNRT